MEFQYKLYDWTGQFKKQINSKAVYSDISFQEELDSGQGSLTLKTSGDLSDFQTSDIIEIRNSENGDLYTGIIEDIGVEEFETSSILSLKFLGVCTALNDMQYKSGASKTFTKTDTVGNIIKDIIDSFNIDYGSLYGDTQILQTNLIRYTGSSIDITGDTISIDFDDINCLASIQKVIKNTGFNFYIGKDGVVFVTQKANQSIKNITFEKEILSINRRISKKDMVNKYYLKRDGGTEKIYEDVPNQGVFGLKEKSESDSDLLDEATQDVKGDEYILENKSEDNIVSIKISPNSVQLMPGEKITTLNSRNNLVEKQITKIEVRKEFSEIYLGNFVSFGKTIVKGT